ncbi:MAG: TetR/AcrR family transcriptional regulator [Terriglobus sp.]
MTKGEETRQRIVELAATLFNQRGYTGCSMSDIMEATGLEKGGIYRYFGSKESLAAEAFQYAVATSRKLRTIDLDNIEGAPEKLRYIMDRFVTEPSPIPGGCPLMNTAIDSDDGNTVLRGLARQAFADWRKRVTAIIQQGIREGDFHKTCNATELADTIIASLEGAQMLSKLDSDRRAVKHIRKSMDLLISLHQR